MEIKERTEALKKKYVDFIGRLFEITDITVSLDNSAEKIISSADIKAEKKSIGFQVIKTGVTINKISVNGRHWPTKMFHIN